MFGHNKDEKNGAGGFVAESVVASEDDVVIDLTPEGKAVDKKKVAMIVAGILVVVGVGAGVGFFLWRSQEEKDQRLDEVMKVYGPDSVGSGSALDNIMNEWTEALIDINNAVIPDTREQIDIEQKCERVLTYLEGISDEHELRVKKGAAISYLTAEGNLSCAEQLTVDFQNGEYSNEERFFYLRGVSDYYRAKGDDESFKRTWDEINKYFEEEINA